MAEAVELHTEETIPVLELIKKTALFNKNELRIINKKRKMFEYKLQRQQKCKKVVLQYIQHEKDLMKLMRQKRLEKGLNQKKNNVDYAIANHINKLFNYAIRHFQTDVVIWISYIKFCKQVRFYTSASRILNQMLELHGDKPDLFKLAAQWEFEECQCVESARKFLLNGLHLHKDSQLLYAEAFKLELDYASTKRKEFLDKRESIPPDGVLQGELAEAMYKCAVKKINQVTFIVDLLNIAKKYDFTGPLQEKILKDLMEQFSKEELTWDTLARMELEGTTNTADPNLQTYKERIKNYAMMYEKAVKSLNTEKMWTIYLDRMLKLNKDTALLPRVKKKMLTEAFASAHLKGILTEGHYLSWAEHLKGSELKDLKALETVLEAGTQKLENSVFLWATRLKYHLSQGEEEKGAKVFREAIARLGDKALTIWKLMVQYYQATSPHEVQTIFKEGTTHSCSSVANPLRVMFLEWLTVTRGISAARKQYEIFLKDPHNLGLHTKMMELEDMQPRRSLKDMRNCHRNATIYFGRENTDVWMDWIRFEGNNGDPAEVSNIHDEAVRSLTKAHLVDIFETEFSLSKAVSNAMPQVKLDPDERMETKPTMKKDIEEL